MRVNNPIITNEEVIHLVNLKIREVHSFDKFFEDFFDKFNNGKHDIIQFFIGQITDKSKLNQIYHFLINYK